MRNKQVLLSLIMVWFMILPVLAFVPTTSGAATGAAVQTKTVKIGMVEEPLWLNPVMATTISDTIVGYNWIWDPLVRWDDDWGIQPCLAESWDWAANGSQITFHIDPDARWHDDTPFTAHDVNWTLFTWTWLGFWVGQTPRIDHRNIRVLDDYTIVLNFVDSGYENIWKWDPYAPFSVRQRLEYNGTPVSVNKEQFLTGMTYVPILAKHLWNPLTWDDPIYGTNSTYFKDWWMQDCIWWGMLSPDWPTPMAGTGPFKFVEHKIGQYLSLEKNANYHIRAPKIDEMLLIFYDSVEFMTGALKTGEIDLCETSPQLSDVAFGPEVTINENSELAWQSLLVNQWFKYLNGSSPFSSERHHALLDPAVKKAMQQAIDKDTIAEVAYLGHARGADSVIHSELKWHNDALIKFPSGVNEAKATLEAAGWTLVDGVYEKDIGGVVESLAFDLKYPVGFPPTQTAVQLIKSYLDAAGFDITLQPRELTTFNEDLTSEEWNYDLAIGIWSQIPDPNSMNQYLTAGALNYSFVNPNGMNLTRVNQIYKQQQLVGDAERALLIDELQQVVYDDSSVIVLVEYNDIELYRNDRYNFTHTDWMSGVLSIWNTNAWLDVDVPTQPTTTTTTGTTTDTGEGPPPLPMEIILAVSAGAVILVIVIVYVVRRK